MVKVRKNLSKKNFTFFLKRMLLSFFLILFSVSTIQKVKAINLDEEKPKFEKVGKTTIEKNIENKQVFVPADSTQLANWNVIVNFGYPITEKDAIQIVDQVDSNLSIEKVEVLDGQGNSVMNNGKLRIKKNKITFEIKKEKGTYTFLENQTYKMIITTKIK